MKALVLAAGYGERLRPLTATTPKPLLEVGGRPLIHYPLAMLRAAGVGIVAINLHHLGSQLKAALGDGESLGLKITYAPEPVLAGTGGPLLGLRDFFTDQPFVIVNGDTIIDLDLGPVLEIHEERRSLVTMVLRASGDPDGYSRIEIDPARRIRRMRLLRPRTRGQFDDFPSDRFDGVTLTPCMFCGVMVCNPTVLAMLPTSIPFSLVKDVLAPALTSGASMQGYVHDGLFRTVDDIASYQALCDEFGATPPRLSFLRS
jgi:NDP-sugar pyrophosphorylase family protein